MTQGLIDSWKANHLRISLFSDKAWDDAVEKIYLDVFSIEPEEVSQKPAAGEATATGNWSSGRMLVKRILNRIDFVLQPVPGPDPELPLLSDIGSIFPQLSSLVASWALRQAQDVNRVAVGCGAFLPADDTNESYRTLRDLIRVIKIDPERFHDFQFQVNLHLQSKVDPDLQLNRITNWTSMKMEAAFINQGASQLIQSKYFSVCTAEVNTDAARTSPIQKNIVPLLIDEACQETLGMLDRGID